MDDLIIDRATLRPRVGYCIECEEEYANLPPSEKKCPICATILEFKEKQGEPEGSTTSPNLLSLMASGLGQSRIVLPQESRPAASLHVNQAGDVGELLRGTREAQRMQNLHEHILEMLQAEVDFGDLAAGIETSQGRGAPPAAKRAIEKLRRFKVTRMASHDSRESEHGASEQSDFFRQVSISLTGIKGSILGIPAGFGPGLPKEGVTLPLALADPIRADVSPLLNCQEVSGRVAAVLRGGCSFARKALVAQEAGAKAVIVIQNSQVFPYTMTDSKDEGGKGGLRVPLVLVSKETGDKILSYLKKLQSTEGESSARATASRRVTVTLTPKAEDRVCPICQDEFLTGQTLVEMPSPCLHAYHEDCILQWFKVRNSCPECRFELETENPQYETQRSMLQRQSEQQEFWYL